MGLRPKKNVEVIPAKLDMVFSRGSDRRWRLQVVDRASSIIVLEADFDADQFSDFMGHTQVTVPGEIIRTNRHGKHMKVHNIEVYCDPFTDWEVVTADALAQANALDAEISDYDLKKRNSHRYNSREGKYRFIARSYHEEEPC